MFGEELGGDSVHFLGRKSGAVGDVIQSCPLVFFDEYHLRLGCEWQGELKAWLFSSMLPSSQKLKVISSELGFILASKTAVDAELTAKASAMEPFQICI